jgi:hypothetical protein
VDAPLVKSFLCPKCDEAIGTERNFRQHLLKKHNLTPEQFYVEINCNGVRPTCACGCGEVSKFINLRAGFSAYVRGHNARANDNRWTEERKQERRRKYATGELSPWNKGLTKKDDDRLQELSNSVSETLKKRYESGEIKSWMCGLTKEDERVRKLVEKSAATQRELYEKGELVAWNDGQTKETDERVLNGTMALKKSYETGKRISWNKGCTLENDERILKHSLVMKQKYGNGELTAWSLGLSKETDDRIKNISIKTSIRLKELHKIKPSYVALSEEEAKKRIEEYSDKFEYVASISTADRPYKLLSRDLLQLRCKQCGNVVEKTYKMLRLTPICFKCNPTGSKEQLALFDFVRSLCADAVSSDRTVIKPQELDIYVPSKKFAIEYNGLYWHSSKVIIDNYHTEKTAVCASNDINLLHIFSDEWDNKREIVKSVIRNRLGLSTTKVFARKCALEQVSNDERRAFFDSTHLDGDANATIAWKLTLNGEPVAMLSLRRAFHEKYRDHIELCRFSTALNTSVVGGLGKLLKVALEWTKANNYNGIMTYVDTRFGDGHGYLTVGFRHVATTVPRFWWTDFHERFNRFKVRANKQAGITQEQAATNAGVTKIFGCPNKVFLLGV